MQSLKLFDFKKKSNMLLKEISNNSDISFWKEKGSVYNMLPKSCSTTCLVLAKHNY